MNLFFLVLALNEKHVKAKINELEALGIPFLIVCGSNLEHPNVVYREPRGKYDAINFGIKFIPDATDIVVLNDVDTKIHNFEGGLREFISGNISLLFARVSVQVGPQKSFYPILDAIRRKVLINASGELMIVRRSILDCVTPLKPCKAEDTYILFKLMELKQKISFCQECYVETERTKTSKNEEGYKRRTVCGIYQALGSTSPSLAIKLFYAFLPIASPFLLIFGQNGYFWVRGILLGFADYLRGDRMGNWKPTQK